MEPGCVAAAPRPEVLRLDSCASLSALTAAAATGEDTFVISTDQVGTSARQGIGKGSFGEVFRGRWRGRDVAVREVRSDEDAAPKMAAALLSEVETLRRCQHHFLVQVLGFSPAPVLTIVTELCACSLHDRLHRHDSRPAVLEKLWLLGDASLGVAYLHMQDVVHGSLKPANILLVEEGLDYNCDRIYTAKVADFGLAKLRAAMAAPEGAAHGTVRYMAPELTAHAPEFSFASDAFAFGVVMWETSAAREPYEAQQDPEALLASVRGGGREDLAEADPELRDLIRSCWDQEPLRRPTFEHIVRCMPGGPSACG